ncbi:MAG TPA: hypothetical protein VD902_07095 [Symbiobacteriaceae bacterium]|nr:hypothetical protein [Symbiobacteriaceae bacterium]
MAHIELAPIRVDAERARAFVLARATAREKARLQGIMGTSGPDRAVVKEIEALQNADGGFPAQGTPGGPSSVDATCFLLHQLKDMPPLPGSPMASRAIAYLRRVQLAGGSWQESPEAAALAGPWARPDNPAAAAYLTALATYHILMLEPEHSDPLRRAMAWLRRDLAGDRGPLPVQTLSLTWGIACRMLGQEAAESRWCFQQLSAAHMSPDELVWFLLAGLEAGAGGRYLLPLSERLAVLGAMQGEDGAWPGEEGLALEATLTALRVFRGYGVI